MGEGPLLYEVQDGVAQIIINRTNQLNALNAEVLDGLERAFRNARRDHQVRCALLTGRGDTFCAGGDMEILKGWTEATSVAIYRQMMEVGRVVKEIYAFPKPLVVAVNGPAVGGGCSLALCGDLIIASEKATFGLVFSRLNLVPDMGASFILPKLVGPLRAKELIYSGRIIPAEEAASYGMVSEVVPHEELEERAMKAARRMARWATQAIGLAKGIIRRVVEGCDLETTLKLEAKCQALLFHTEDTKEGIRAFLEKRKPNFRNV